MRVRVIARFKNEAFFQARKEVGLTQQQLGEQCGLGKSGFVVINGFENFRSYPKYGSGKRQTLLIIKLQELLKISYDDLFPQIYRDAVDRKLGKPIQKTFDALELPEHYVEKNLILPDPADIYEGVELKEQLGEALKFLTEREAKVLMMRFGLANREHSLEEVGQQFKVTRTRIAQIEAKALQKLKHPSLSRKLKSFVKE